MEQRAASEKRVLIVDDELLTAFALQEALQESGFWVTVAVDGEQALTACARFHIDVVVTDLEMPRLDGWGLIRRLSVARPDLPVVVLTGHPPDEVATNVLDPDVRPAEFLLKPVDPQCVVGCVRAVFPKRG